MESQSWIVQVTDYESVRVGELIQCVTNAVDMETARKQGAELLGVKPEDVDVKEFELG